MDRKGQAKPDIPHGNQINIISGHPQLDIIHEKLKNRINPGPSVWDTNHTFRTIPNDQQPTGFVKLLTFAISSRQRHPVLAIMKCWSPNVPGYNNSYEPRNKHDPNHLELWRLYVVNTLTNTLSHLQLTNQRYLINEKYSYPIPFILVD
jgi:hypothetical protein